MATATETMPSGHQLLSHLRTTGTSPDRCKLVDDFLKANKKATAEDVFEHLKSLGMHVIPLGTLRKAGKFFKGDEWDMTPENMTPDDETKALRRENADLARQLKTREGEVARLKTDIVNLQRKIELLQADAKVPMTPPPPNPPGAAGSRDAKAGKKNDQEGQPLSPGSERPVAA